jgi:branched-chain amino acid transport system ATP-binding protein
VISGLVRPSSGSVFFSGQNITTWPAWKIARSGLVHAPEGRSVFATLSVEENLILAFRRAVGRRREGDPLERAYDAFPRLRERRSQPAGALSGGEQRMLTLAKVLALSQRLLVVDELSLGLAPAVVDEVYTALETILADGTSLLVVEQQLARALAIADHVVVLASGRVVRQGATNEVGDIVSTMLPVAASELTATQLRGQQPAGDPCDDPEPC